MNAPDPTAPSSPADGPVRFVPVAIGVLALLLVGVCLVSATLAKIRSDAEDEVTQAWDATARQLRAKVRGAPRGEAPLRGPLLPIRIDKASEEGRVDFHVFLALPEEWRPKPKTSPAQVVVLGYDNAELRHYGQSARGGDRIRYRQSCTIELYDLDRGELIAERKILSPDPLPEDFGTRARLSVPPERVVAELRDLAR